MKLKVCSQPGCFAMVEPPNSYCVRHQWAQEHRAKAAAAAATARWDAHHARTPGPSIYRTARWRKLRAEKLAMSPYCERCPKQEKATSVDHIIPHRGREELAFDMDNLQSLCKRCHARKSREDRDR